MSKGLKGWLWFVLVINALSTLSLFAFIAINPLYIGSIVTEAILIAGVCVLLFKQKKIGFYLMCIAAVIGFVFNLLLGANIALAIISLVAAPLITFLLMRKDWAIY